MCAAGECGNQATELLIDSLISLLAGFVEAVIGGGGLIFVPALFAVFANTRPAALFGITTGALVDGFVDSQRTAARAGFEGPQSG